MTSKYKGPLGTTRMYLVDAKTGEELDHPLNGGAWLSLGHYVITKGFRWQGTATDCVGVDMRTRERITITAEDFGDRLVAVKVWRIGEQPEWRLLVKGSAPNGTKAPVKEWNKPGIPWIR